LISTLIEVRVPPAGNCDNFSNLVQATQISKLPLRQQDVIFWVGAGASPRLWPNDKSIVCAPAPANEPKAERDKVPFAGSLRPGWNALLVQRSQENASPYLSLLVEHKDRKDARAMTSALAERGDWERSFETLDRQIRLVEQERRLLAAKADHLRRTNDFVRRAQWPEAIAAMTVALGVDSREHATWYRIAPLFVEAGDVAGYDRHRRALLGRYGERNDPQVAERTAKACLILPGSTDVIRRAAGLAGLAVDQGAQAGGLLPYFLLASGLAEYRRSTSPPPRSRSVHRSPSKPRAGTGVYRPISCSP
jgi:hypothetical protein